MAMFSENSIQYRYNQINLKIQTQAALAHHQALKSKLPGYNWFFYDEFDKSEQLSSFTANESISFQTSHHHIESLSTAMSSIGSVVKSNQNVLIFDNGIFPSENSNHDKWASQDISQGHIYNQLINYLNHCGALEGKVREVFLNAGGDCNGWSFLHAYYSNIKSGQEFIDLLNYISKWNGNLNSLNTNYGMSAKLQSKYPHGKALFEQTINDVAWFTHIKTAKVCNYQYTQDDRLEQWEIIKDNKMELESIYTFLRLDKTILNKTNLTDILQIAAKWTDSFIDLGVYAPLGAHSLSLYITPQGNFKYYDCNTAAGPIETGSAYQVSQYIFSSLSFLTDTCALRDFSCYKFYPNNQPCPDSLHLPAHVQLSPTMNPKSVETFLTISVDSKQLDLFCSIYKMYDLNANKISSQVKEKAFSTGAQEGHLDVVSLLLSDKAVYIDCQSGMYHKTPLMLAAEKGHLDVVSLLLENGANSQAKDLYGNTAYQLAIKNNHYDIANLFDKTHQDSLMDLDDSIDLFHLAMPQIKIQDCLSFKADGIDGLDQLKPSAENTTTICAHELPQANPVPTYQMVLSMELQMISNIE